MKKITVSAAILAVFMFIGVAQANTVIISNCINRRTVTTLKLRNYLGIIPTFSEQMIVPVEAHTNQVVDIGNSKVKHWVLGIENCPRLYEQYYDSRLTIFSSSFRINITGNLDSCSTLFVSWDLELFKEYCSIYKDNYAQ